MKNPAMTVSVPYRVFEFTLINYTFSPFLSSPLLFIYFPRGMKKLSRLKKKKVRIEGKLKHLRLVFEVIYIYIYVYTPILPRPFAIRIII